MFSLEQIHILDIALQLFKSHCPMLEGSFVDKEYNDLCDKLTIMAIELLFEREDNDV